jgi:prepilin-type N-terminal cleavage/methylation domain-containing protein
MLHLPFHQLNRQNFDQGYTLVETLAVVIIVGILCAIAAPSLLAMQGVAKLNSSADNIRTALETSQFQAVKKHTSCQVYISSNSNRIVGDCLMNGSATSQSIANVPNGLPLFNLDPGITVTTAGLTGTPPQAIYNRQGLTQSSGTIILSSNETGDKRCLILNKGAGLIRGGKYINNTTCQVTE